MMKKLYLIPVGVLVFHVLYTTYHFRYFERFENIQGGSVVGEGLVLVVLIVGLFLLQKIKSLNRSYFILTIGLVFLNLYAITDFLDEIFKHPNFHTLIFEDIPLVVGLSLLVWGNTEWANTRKDLEKKLEDLAKFPSENPYPVLRISKKGIILYSNGACEKVLTGRECRVGEKVPDVFWKTIRDSFESMESKVFDVSSNGVVFSFASTPVRGTDYANLYGREVTKERKIEEMKSDFVSLVSHQLKTPVSEIKGFIDNMLDGLTGELTSKQREYLSSMQKTSIKNLKLITDILNISKIERGVLSVDIEKVKLKEIVESSLHIYERTIKDKGLSLNLNQLDNNIIIKADKDKAVEAISNVLDNAVKFTERGGITIKSSIEEDFAMLEIADTGKGLSSNVLKTLFDKERVLKGQASPKEGAGLGLYLAKQFMLQQNGDITVKSIEGKGSIFALKFPLDES